MIKNIISWIVCSLLYEHYSYNVEYLVTQNWLFCMFFMATYGWSFDLSFTSNYQLYSEIFSTIKRLLVTISTCSNCSSYMPFISKFICCLCRWHSSGHDELKGKSDVFSDFVCLSLLLSSITQVSKCFSSTHQLMGEIEHKNKDALLRWGQRYLKASVPIYNWSLEFGWKWVTWRINKNKFQQTQGKFNL